MIDFLTFGEAMALFVAGETGSLDSVSQFSRTIAGAELNVAIGMARLGFQSAYLTRVGDDALGRGLLEAFAAEGLECSRVATDKHYPTGLMFKSRTDDGSDPAIAYFRRGSAASHLSPDDFPEQDAQHFRAVHLTGIAPALSDSARELTLHMAKSFRAAGKWISFDPNLRPQLWPDEKTMVKTLNEFARFADVVLPGIGEGEILVGSSDPAKIAQFYLENGAKKVVVKLGGDGAYYQDENGSGTAEGVKVEKIVDTVGAGDGFAVGVISALLEGKTLAEAAARGNVIGARVVQFPGDSDGLPTRAELEAMLS